VVKPERPRLTVLILTEDGSHQAHDVVVALVKKAFRILSPACRTNRIGFEPQNDMARRYVVGNFWKGDGPKKGRARFQTVELSRLIATKLLESDPPGFVVFHFDGDRTWSRSHESENARKFQERIVRGVRLLVSDKLQLDAAAVDRILTGLRALTPFYSIEAWLYQNLGEARKIAAELGNPAELVEQLAAWEADRSRLDELERPKEHSLLRDRHNQRLAEAAWPADDVYLLERSFTRAVDGLAECRALLDALADT
jgi:hypothetical protein